MKQDVLKQAALFSKEHRRRTRRHKVFSVLAAVMVFCTTYALIMPAITLEHEALPVCGLEEHTHTEACYGEPELVCGLEETSGEGHVHTDVCYETVETEREVLTCDLIEGEGHVHTDACYAEPPATTGTELICELEENEEHTHSDGCYAPVETDGERVLICGLEECEPHTHGEGCYTTEVVEEKALTCGEEEVVAHTHTEECYERPLICGLEEHTHTEECYTEEISDGEVPEGEVPEEPFVELERTIESMGYRAVFHVTYYGEPAEGDLLDFTAETSEFDDPENERDYEYTAAIGENTTLPSGRTEFVLTNNGEAVDRALYDVTVEIIPSRYMVGGLYQMSSETLGTLDLPDTMDLTAEDYESEPVESAEPVADEAEPVVDETEPVAGEAEPEGHTHSEPFVGFMAYELEDGALALRGAVPVDFSAIEDIDAYMADIYDEEGNPVYDETYAFVIQPQEQDFMFAAGVSEDPIETLGQVSQAAWSDGVMTLWDGYTPNSQNTSGSHNKNDHVAGVYMTHSDSNGVKDPNAPQQVKIWEGTADQSKYTVSYDGTGEYADRRTNQNPDGNQSIGDKRVNLKQNIYLKATNVADTWTTCEKEEAERITINVDCGKGSITHWFPSNTYMITKGDPQWEAAKNATERQAWGVCGSGSHTAYIESIKYEKLLRSGRDYALLEIVPDPGYYVTQVVIACTNLNGTVPTGCSVWSDRQGVFTSEFGVADGSHVSLTVPSTAFCHYASTPTDRPNDTYYILIQTAPIPSPLFVSYEYGNIEQMGLTREQMSTFTGGTVGSNSGAWLAPNGKTNRNTAAGNNVLNATTVDQLRKMKSDENWSTGELDYYVSNISPEAEAAANAHGWRFAGWRLEYWGDVTKNINNPYTTAGEVQNVAGQFPQFDTTNNQNNLDNGFAGSRTISANELKTAEGRKKNLMTNAKLIAQWEKIPAAEVVKNVIGLEDSETVKINEDRTFQFEIERTDSKEEFTFDATVMQYQFVNGVRVQTGETTTTVNSTGGKALFTITVYGNDSETYKISGLPDNSSYRVTEIDANGEDYKTTYANQEFTVANKSDTITAANTVTVTNDYAPVKSFELTVEKVTTEKIENTQPPLSADPNDPNAEWKALGGAKFDLYAGVKNTDGTYDWPTKVNEESIAPEAHGGGAMDTQDSLSYDVYYKLVETEAPPGYNKLAEPIYFKAERGTGENGADKLELYTLNTDGKGFTKIENAEGLNANRNVNTDALKLIVANYGGFELPSTGGPGTYVYALGGMLLVAAAAILMYKSTRRREGGLTD